MVIDKPVNRCYYYNNSYAHKYNIVSNKLKLYKKEI